MTRAMAMQHQHTCDEGARLRQRHRQRHHRANGAIETTASGIGERLAHARACFSQAKLKGFEGNGDGNEGRIGWILGHKKLLGFESDDLQ